MRGAFHEYELHLRHRWEISGGAAESKCNAYFEIEEDDLVGRGEAAFHRGFGESPQSVRNDLARARADLSAGDSFDLASLGLRGSSRTAVEMAWLDLQARRAGQSLAEFLGAPVATEPVATSFSIGIDRAEHMAEKTREAEAFEVLKIKLGTPRDRENFTAVRAVTGRPIRVDANGGWQSREEAVRMIDWLADDRGVEFVEQPLPPGRFDDTAWLRERSALPIVLDEDVRFASDLDQLAGACDGVNIKLMKTGGLTEALRTIEAARARKLKVMLGCMIESSLAIGAALHLAALADWIDLDGHLLVANDPYRGIRLTGGRLHVPDGPGIGVQPI